MVILVIGTGSIGTRHLGNLTALGAQAEACSMRAGGMDGALARIAAGGLQGVVIATETHLRLPLIAACAGQGLPIYVEKPLAFAPAEVAAIYEAAAPVAARSMVGLMMRYHPAFRHLAQADLGDTYAYSFDIGHDVTQWRANWRFADSYAARPDGGGVLLDLCHELDMATCLFPAASLHSVASLGQARYPGVDFATQVTLGGPATGMVRMDYLSPQLVRRIDIAGTGQRHMFDLAAGSYMVADASGTRPIAITLERNAMFLAAMRDFLALIAGRPTSDVEHLPRLDLVRASCDRIAGAYGMRQFGGQLVGDKP